ncbi:TPA: hypothetical protein ACN343_001440 [Vibrio parahaemolyticus]|nr:hypothetical protein [Vibrio parahaemolyticus]HCE1418684.1 hypothetical protein [Vibrio parahaemolyticus]HCE3264835.1 hypothetical protein [Vibrio parahaemolyticus]HCM0391760.1 hypothetical protein [Vibrio parahaemolyticus]HCM0422880.1 hypothetical protein [Vibrio parahaemolyticus]
MARRKITIESIERDAPELLSLYENKCPEDANHFYERLYIELENISKCFLKRREDKFFHGEDELSNSLCDMLKEKLFSAEREADRSGNVDILVKARVKGIDLEWLGEAKILSAKNSNSNVYDGYEQITTRYSKGMDREHGLIVYVKKDKMLARLEQWWVYLKNKQKNRAVNIKKIACSISKSAFFTDEVDIDTGYDYRLRHFFIPIHFKPNDKSARKAKKFVSKIP